MRPPYQLLVSVTGLAAVLLIGGREADADPEPSQRTDCAVSTTTVPSEYWFYHALATSNPALFDPSTGSAPCLARKVTRT
jgi:hypothetical protein